MNSSELSSRTVRLWRTLITRNPTVLVVVRFHVDGDGIVDSLSFRSLSVRLPTLILSLGDATSIIIVESTCFVCASSTTEQETQTLPLMEILKESCHAWRAGGRSIGMAAVS